MSARRRPHIGKLDLKSGRISMEHGAGGKLSAQLVAELFQPAFMDPALEAGDDGAALDLSSGALAMSTDTFVVSPLFFPGGDIGKLAACGTINDVAMMGADVAALSVGFVIEEGFALADLDRIARSLGDTARAARVRIVTGDTKVVERGKGDGVFINTTGVGVRRPGVSVAARSVRPDDVVIVSGPVGDHGVAILSRRPGYDFEADVESDCAALNGLVAALLDAVPGVKALRDPTRGGIAAQLNEMAWTAGCGFALDEDAVPVRPEVVAVCDLLGLDPLDLPCEGRLLAFVAPGDADAALAALRAHPLGQGACVIGAAMADERRLVTARTGFGGQRLVDWRAGEPLPRIC
jgi:hydrogenase expression/formation protein HypE